MAGARQLKVDLDEDQYEAVMSAVDSGDYASTDAVVGAALAEWQTNRLLGNLGVDEVRRLWDEGLASGEPIPFDIEDMKRKAHERLAAMPKRA